MKIIADTGTCEGLGMCESLAHDLFEVGDDGTVIVHEESPPEEDRDYVQAAVDACPVSALRLQD